MTLAGSVLYTFVRIVVCEELLLLLLHGLQFQAMAALHSLNVGVDEKIILFNKLKFHGPELVD